MDSLSLVLCQLEIRHILSRRNDGGDPGHTVSIALLDAIQTSVKKGNYAWFDLMDGLDPVLISKVRAVTRGSYISVNTKQVRDHAEHELLHASDFVTEALALKNPIPQLSDETFIWKHLTVVESTARKFSDERPSGAITALVERLKAIADAFERVNGPIEHLAHSTSSTDNASLTASPLLVQWYILFLIF